MSLWEKEGFLYCCCFFCNRKTSPPLCLSQYLRSFLGQKHWTVSVLCILSAVMCFCKISHLQLSVIMHCRQQAAKTRQQHPVSTNPTHTLTQCQWNHDICVTPLLKPLDYRFQGSSQLLGNSQVQTMPWHIKGISLRICCIQQTKHSQNRFQY